MKRTLAAILLLTALAVFVKLAIKPMHHGEGGADGAADAQSLSHLAAVPADPVARLTSKYRSDSTPTRDLVMRVAQRFGHNALEIDRTDGLRGLTLLDRMDIEAIFLYEKYPREFHRLRDMIGSDAAASLLLHWREYFGHKRADETDRGTLIAEIGSLSPTYQKAAARFPAALPLILTDPAGVTELINRNAADPAEVADMIAILNFVSLEDGTSNLRTALRTFEANGALALDAFRLMGLEGFGLVALYGPIIQYVGTALPLDQTLILIRVNAESIDELLRSHRPEFVAGHIRHVAAAGLVEIVASHPAALRLCVEYGGTGDRALRRAGADAAEVVFNNFSDPTLRRQAVEALALHGPMALAILDKYAPDPDFREILRTHGAVVIPPIAEADAGPQTIALLQARQDRTWKESLALTALFLSGDSGQSVIRTIKKDGPDRAVQLYDGALEFYQFFPLYDVSHLANVVGRGYTPTSGELTWALIDASFVVTDLLALATVQPEAAVAAEAARTEMRASVRSATRSLGRTLTQAAPSQAGKISGRAETRAALEKVVGKLSDRWARWWTVRSAGGLYQVLRRLPEALPRLSLEQISEMAGPLCARAGIRLSKWQPVRFLRDGVEVISKIPPERGLKYLAAQGVQAGVGVVGFHKMEEHLASRRPRTPGS
jgi:hypothetical protein